MASPFEIVIVVMLLAFIVGLYRRSTPAFKLYFIYIPFGVVGLISLATGNNPLPTSGYGVASSLQLTGYLAALAFSIGVLECQAIKDFRHLKDFNG